MQEKQKSAVIGIEMPEGQIWSITVWNWGQLARTGKILNFHYRNRMKVMKLILLGEVLNVGKELGESIPWKEVRQELYPPEYRALLEERCIAVYRDGEIGEKPEIEEYPDRESWSADNQEIDRYLYDGSRGGKDCWLYSPPKFILVLGRLDWALEKQQEKWEQAMGIRPTRAEEVQEYLGEKEREKKTASNTEEPSLEKPINRKPASRKKKGQQAKSIFKEENIQQDTILPKE